MNEPVLITNISKFHDHRGVFYESYKSSNLISHGIYTDFVQDNQSESKAGTVRGLHYQWNKPMGKLIRVSKGKILDTIIDLRANSSSFGQMLQFSLTEDNGHQLWVPPHFGHGFSALTDCIVHYKCTNEYNKAGESGINPLDAGLDINWQVPFDKIIISDKDSKAQSFESYKLNSKF